MEESKNSPYIYGIGETVFDIIFRNMQAVGSSPGGSSFNSMISLGRLGIACSFVSEIGKDTAGDYIKEFLNENKVDSSYLLQKGKTAIALAYLNEASDAKYDFYKDVLAVPEENALPGMKTGDFLLFGSYYAINPAKRRQVEAMVNRARGAESIIYYDPNFRQAHMNELDVLLPVIKENMSLSSIVRASDEDIHNIFSVETAAEAWDIVSDYCDYFIYTRGAEGIDFFSKQIEFHLDVEAIEPVSSIGAGDTLNAGILAGMYRKGVSLQGLGSLSAESWKEILAEASQMSAEVCLSYDNFIQA